MIVRRQSHVCYAYKPGNFGMEQGRSRSSRWSCRGSRKWSRRRTGFAVKAGIVEGVAAAKIAKAGARERDRERERERKRNRESCARRCQRVSAVNKTDKHSNFCYKNIRLGVGREWTSFLLCLVRFLWSCSRCLLAKQVLLKEHKGGQTWHVGVGHGRDCKCCVVVKGPAAAAEAAL